jgi:Cdc6-like AAA superfamily ATPase
MTASAESEARRALQRLRRSLEKAERDLGQLEAALRHAEGDDFPVDLYREAEAGIDALRSFTDREAQRLQEKILIAGGLEPGRVRRSGV